MKGYLFDVYVHTIDEIKTWEEYDEEDLAKLVSWCEKAQPGDTLSLGTCGDLMCVEMKNQFTFEDVRKFINHQYLNGMITKDEKSFMLSILSGMVIEED